VLGLGFGQEDSVDAIFGREGSASDSLADGSLGEPAPAGSDERAQVDPLAFFAVAPVAPPAAPQRDDVPLLNRAISLPQAEAPARREKTRLPSNEPLIPVGKRSPRAGVVVRSWEDTPAAGGKRGGPLDGLPPAAAAPSAIPPAVDEGDVPASLVGSAAAASAGSAPTELLAAFQRGLSVRVDLPALTPELMERIGVLLREATQGTVDLLKARAETKREVRAQVTMVVSKGNNPLKFSPDVGFALSQLLLPQGWGFMRPEEAMRDAYDDLRAHQFGFMAGMRAALSGVLSRFEPAALEDRLAGRRLLDNLLPGSRKAKLWDLFEQMHGEISREANDDFAALFGREFVRAYEEQVARLQAEQNTE
jgi:FHA domain-containing protein